MAKNLLEIVAEATGLPKAPIMDELKNLAANAGLKPDEVSLDELREIMASYLQDIMSETHS